MKRVWSTAEGTVARGVVQSSFRFVCADHLTAQFQSSKLRRHTLEGASGRVGGNRKAAGEFELLPRLSERGVWLGLRSVFLCHMLEHHLDRIFRKKAEPSDESEGQRRLSLTLAQPEPAPTLETAASSTE